MHILHHKWHIWSKETVYSTINKPLQENHHCTCLVPTNQLNKVIITTNVPVWWPATKTLAVKYNHSTTQSPEPRNQQRGKSVIAFLSKQTKLKTKRNTTNVNIKKHNFLTYVLFFNLEYIHISQLQRNLQKIFLNVFNPSSYANLHRSTAGATYYSPSK